MSALHWSAGMRSVLSDVEIQSVNRATLQVVGEALLATEISATHVAGMMVEMIELLEDMEKQ